MKNTIIWLIFLTIVMAAVFAMQHRRGSEAAERWASKVNAFFGK